MATGHGGRKIHVGGAVSFGMPRKMTPYLPAYGAGIIIIINDYIAHEVPKWQDLNSKVVPHHAVRWRNIAIELGLAPSLLDTIAENCGEKVKSV